MQIVDIRRLYHQGSIEWVSVREGDPLL